MLHGLVAIACEEDANHPGCWLLVGCLNELIAAKLSICLYHTYGMDLN